MKIQGTDLERIRAAIAPLDTPAARDAYRAGNYPRAESTKNVDKRYRWDLLHASAIRAWELYDIPGVRDTHIDTALRAIVPPLAS